MLVAAPVKSYSCCTVTFVASLAHLATIKTSELKGIGPNNAEALSELGIRNVAELLHHVPRRYLDRSAKPAIEDTSVGSQVTLIGEVHSVKLRRPRPNLQIIEATIADDSATMKAVWFNQSFRINQLKEGTLVALSGEVDAFRGLRQMTSPDVDVLHAPSEGLLTGRVVPIHPAVAKIKVGTIRRAIHNALKRSSPIDDVIPVEFLAAHRLMDRDTAFHSIHFPDTLEDIASARKRLVYDELLRLELALAVQKRHQMDTANGIVHDEPGDLARAFIAGLPYELTGAQRRALEEIDADLQSAFPMHRLLQGEVGSGKTVVSVATLLRGIEGGFQGALMAPTEVLAEQHYLGVRNLLADAGLSPGPIGAGGALGMGSLFATDQPTVRLGLLTGSTATTNYHPDISRAGLLDDIASGQVELAVGTHALIQEGVSFGRLGVVVVDEQHRFGVAQRVRLRDKSELHQPDTLIMTATPIPRTLSMTLYGDLDVSVVDEMPPGRSPVATKHLSGEREAEAWNLIRGEVAKGRQAFVVCPLVDESKKVEAASATEEHQRLSQILAGMAVGLIHGQLNSREKEAAMAAFRRGEIDVLVSTTVIEVGIDVPNATVMVIEDADRFGLSQLHQLRGRVGRGEHGGQCVLLSDPKTEEAEERIAAMAATTDGFRLAEEDLRIRGQGTVFGTRQSGVKDLRIADILEDFDTLRAARKDAFGLVASDPELKAHPELAEELRAMLGEEVEWLFVS